MNDFLGHRDNVAVDRGGVDEIGRARMAQPGAREQLVGRRHLAHRAALAHAGPGLGQHAARRLGRGAQWRRHVGLRLIGLIGL